MPLGATWGRRTVRFGLSATVVCVLVYWANCGIRWDVGCPAGSRATRPGWPRWWRRWPQAGSFALPEVSLGGLGFFLVGVIACSTPR